MGLFAGPAPGQRAGDIAQIATLPVESLHFLAGHIERSGYALHHRAIRHAELNGRKDRGDTTLQEVDQLADLLRDRLSERLRQDALEGGTRGCSLELREARGEASEGQVSRGMILKCHRGRPREIVGEAFAPGSKWRRGWRAENGVNASSTCWCCVVNRWNVFFMAPVLFLTCPTLSSAGSSSTMVDIPPLSGMQPSAPWRGSNPPLPKKLPKHNSGLRPKIRGL